MVIMYFKSSTRQTNFLTLLTLNYIANIPQWLPLSFKYNAGSKLQTVLKFDDVAFIYPWH